MVNPTIFLLSIDCKKKKISICYLILLEIQNVKIIKRVAKVELFGCAVSVRLLKIEHFFFLQLIANKNK